MDDLICLFLDFGMKLEHMNIIIFIFNLGHYCLRFHSQAQ